MKIIKNILENGNLKEMRNIFQIAELLGGGVKNELSCMFGYIICSVFGYIKPYSEGWY